MELIFKSAQQHHVGSVRWSMQGTGAGPVLVIVNIFDFERSIMNNELVYLMILLYIM